VQSTEDVCDEEGEEVLVFKDDAKDCQFSRADESSGAAVLAPAAAKE
jgi:hypothetical protein